MDIALKKLDLVQHLLTIWDEAALMRVAKVIEEEAQASVQEGDGITDEEYAAFEEESAKRDRGELRFHTEEESIRLIKGGFEE